MIGLYVHIPFCVRKCAYCDFVSFPGREGDFARYRDALLREMALRLPDAPIDTVFFGGGTPSLPPPDFIPAILDAVRAHANLLPDAEITCEANPGTLTGEHVSAWRKAGVNRLSLGAQAFQDRLLGELGRIHRWEDVERSAVLWGDDDALSLDLMHGLPGQTVDDWRTTLDAAIKLRPGHLSCYALIVEEGTPFGERFDVGELILPGEDEDGAMHAMAAETLARAGYEHYEVSNWARGGRVCRHNLHTWQRREYIGIGCAAASFYCGVRQRNTPDLDAYLARVEAGSSSVEETMPIDEREAWFEEMMLGLRLIQGIELSGGAFAHYEAKLRRLERQGLLTMRDRHIRLTPRGMDVMNAVLVTLME